MKELKDMIETREHFISMSREVAPLIEEIARIMKEHGVTEMANITISTSHTGFEIYDGSGWKLGRYGVDGVMKVMNEYMEPLFPEESAAG